MRKIKKVRRVLVDMSCTLVHHGHVRLINRAASYGQVIVALTTDDQVLQCKGYIPELSFSARKEILESLRNVHEVVPSPWLIDEAFMQSHGCELLIHGEDNPNPISKEKIILFPRTEGISSTDIRHAAKKIIELKNSSVSKISST